jgi:PPK2 family polyphosphate:nucleotide phosphotransferase
MFPAVNLGPLERYRIPTDWQGKLADIDPRDREAMPFPREESKAATAADIGEIGRLQEILYAQAKYALLVILQGQDTSGKDGTIRRVFSPINPAGTVVTGFKKPTSLELSHDFLWRVHKAVPPLGMIGIFNRSHYEDVLVARVHALVPTDRLDARYPQIKAFERHLAENDVVILKFYLHISRKEQKARLQARLDDPTKRWKFNPADLAERRYWDDYISAYQIALACCSTEWASWFIIPADRKWYRNAVVARIVRSTLEGLDLHYPSQMPGLDQVRLD